MNDVLVHKMNRRNFLTSAIAALGALAIDPEELLWTPGKKTIFIPELPTGLVTDDVLDKFLSELKVVRGFATEYEKDFPPSHLGDTIYIRRPALTFFALPDLSNNSH